MSTPASSVTFQIEGPVYTALSRKAKAEGLATGRYARMLFEAAWAARCKPVGDKELEAAIERMFKATVQAAPVPDNRPNPFEEKWMTATNTIQSLRERIAELEATPPVAPSDDAALRAKITELSAQIVAAGEDRATAEAAVAETAKHLARISDLEAELGTSRLDFGQMSGWYQVALKRISDLEGELAAAQSSKPITISTDELVTAIVFGWGASFDTTAMARNTGLCEATVTRILGAWRDEIQSRRAA